MFSQPPGEGVLAALRSNDNTTTKIVSLDLDEPSRSTWRRREHVRAHRGSRPTNSDGQMATSAA